MLGPVPLLILGPRDSSEKQYYGDLELNRNGAVIAPLVYYLGQSGIFITRSGLSVAFISLSEIQEVFSLFIRTNGQFQTSTPKIYTNT